MVEGVRVYSIPSLRDLISYLDGETLIPLPLVTVTSLSMGTTKFPKALT